MVMEDFKEAVTLLGKRPVLWVPGIVAGLLAIALWILYNISGTFFASRLLLVCWLILTLFIAGMFAVIKKNEGGIRELVSEGARHYFRVLLPQMVIVFAVMLVFVLIIITAAIVTGGVPDMIALSAVSIFIIIPTFFLTYFADAAAVFEDQRVFDSIRRSIELTVTHAGEVIGFFIVSISVAVAIFLALMAVWEASLYDQLAPIMNYNETQLSALTPDQLISLIGQNGMWVTSIVIFFGILLALPILSTYKVCFFKKLSGMTAKSIQQTGEYDSKGRWYKY
jgi:uncharacterized membrane protein